MKAVIMAGGVGKRLRPLTCDCPKPMTPMMNRPVMAYSVELLTGHGVEDIAVTLQYLPNQIMDCFGDGSGYGAQMHYFVERTPLGTAGSVRQAADMLDETFAVVSGDALTNIDLTRALEFHKAKGSICTLVLKRVEVPLDYGIVLLDGEGRVRRFYEKPGWEEIYSDLANTGIYIMEPEALALVKPGRFTDFARNLFPELLEAGYPMYGFVTDEYWCDVGDLAQYLQAHMDILDERCKVRLNARRSGNMYIENGAFVDSGAVITGPCYVGSGSYIGSGVKLGPYCVIGGGVKLEGGSSVKRSVLWNGVSVRSGAQVRGAVICNGSTIKDSAAVFEEAAVGKDSVLGEGATVHPKVFIWPAKRIEPKAEVREDCVWSGGGRTRLFEEGAVSGRMDLELSPQTALKLGAAFALALKTPPRAVGAGSDGHMASVALKQAFIAGLLAYGADVYDLERLTMPMLRYGVKELGLSGGSMITAGSGDGKLSLRLLEADGAPASPKLQRSLQEAFERFDARPEREPRLGLIRMRRDISPFYRASLARLCDGALAKNPKRVLISADEPSKGVILELFHGLGWSAEASGEKGAAFAREALDARFDAGFMISDGGETLTVCDDAGGLISGEAKNALLIFAHVNAWAEPHGRVVLPLGTPDALVRYLKDRKIEAKLVKSDGVSLHREMAEASPALALAWFDAAAGALSIAQCMAKTGLSAGEMLAMLPEFHLCSGFVPCSWRDVGRILRELSGGAPSERVDCIEGVRVRHDNGWALIRPSHATAGFSVLSEGLSAEYAEELTDLYVRRVRALKDE